MRNPFGKLFAPPAFPEDPDKTRKARYANAISLTFIALAIGYEIVTQIFRGISGWTIVDSVVTALAMTITIGWLLLKRGYVRFASTLLVIAIWTISNGFAASGFGIRDTSFIINFSIILMAGLLFNWQAAAVVSVASIISGFGLANAEKNGLIHVATNYPATSFAQDITFVFGMNAVLMYLLITGLENALKQSRINLENLETANVNLEMTNVNLNQIQGGLIAANKHLERRASQLQAVSNMAHRIASVQDIDTLLPDVTKLVSEHFGFYHVGIFLVDDEHKFAVLRASNSEGGMQMLNRQHKLKLDQNSVVGFATSRNQPRVALDVAVDSVFFNNPDLPNTRSEIALPLHIGGRVIGALDVQSIQPNAFSDEDISALSTLADQIAIAIENARLFSEARQALAESERTFERYIKQEWNTFAKQAKSTGYLFDGNHILPYNAKGQREKAKTLAQTGRLALEKESTGITIPIRFRGQTMGFLEVKSKTGSRQWTRDEIALLESAVERAALALENARLVESAQIRASRERVIGEISSKIGAVSDVDSILQTAVEELGRQIGGAAEVSLELVGKNE